MKIPKISKKNENRIKNKNRENLFKISKMKTKKIQNFLKISQFKTKIEIYKIASKTQNF